MEFKMRVEIQILCQSVHIVFLLLSWGVAAADDKRFLKDAGFTDTVCTSSALTDYGVVRSVLQCSTACGADADCISFFYNKISGACNGVSTVYASASGCDPDTGSLYYRPETAVSPETIPCSSNSDCQGNTQCSSSNYCQCLPGYSLVPATGQCVIGCQEYGDTFSEYRDEDLNCGGTFFSNVDEAQCKANCFPENCVSVSFNAKISACKVRQCTPLDDPLVNYNQVHTFVRNCA